MVLNVAQHDEEVIALKALLDTATGFDDTAQANSLAASKAKVAANEVLEGCNAGATACVET